MAQLNADPGRQESFFHLPLVSSVLALFPACFSIESGKDAATSMAPGLHLPRLAPQKESTSVPADASSPSAAARWPGLLHMPISESSPVTLVGQAWVIPTSRTGSGGLA